MRCSAPRFSTARGVADATSAGTVPFTAVGTSTIAGVGVAPGASTVSPNDVYLFRLRGWPVLGLLSMIAASGSRATVFPRWRRGYS